MYVIYENEYDIIIEVLPFDTNDIKEQRFEINFLLRNITRRHNHDGTAELVLACDAYAKSF